MYRDIEHIDCDLPKAKQNTTLSKCAKGLASAIAILAISGCVSQQSAFDFNEQQVVQPIPTGASLASGNSANENLVTTNISNNIPTRAPRPGTTLAQINAPSPAASVSQETQAVSPNPSTLAVTQTPDQAPTANVIAAATQPIAEQTASAQIATPTNTQVAATTPAPVAPIPVARQQVANAATQTAQQTVEVASLSPTVEAAPSVEAPQTEVVKKKSFFEKLFASKEKTPRPAANVNKPKVQKSSRASSRISTASSTAARPSKNITKPKVQNTKTIVASARSSTNENSSALPGVKTNNEIFGIKEAPKTSKSKKTTQVASVGSFGKLSPNGLRLQHSKVQVACLKPGVLRILKQVERRYGKKPIITSGYRSPKGNRRAGGARNSQHIFCKAVDIQVEGVSKWKLAKYIRTIPGRGGVGTYCRTKSVHFDIGSKRDWHHPCRKSSKRKRKKT